MVASSAEFVVSLTVLLFGAACSILTVERLYFLRHHGFWYFANSVLSQQEIARGEADRYWKTRRFLLFTKLSAGMLCMAFAFSPSLAAPVLGIAVVVLFWDRRLEFLGGDGADQKLRVVGTILFATLICSRFDERCLPAGLALVSMHLTFAYSAAGLAKLRSPAWRLGDSIRNIASSTAFGQGRALQFLSSRLAWCQVISICVIAFEAAFPLFFLSRSLLVVGLCLAFCFHLANSMLLGLNSFLWVFPISYPAALYTQSNFTFSNDFLSAL